MAKLTEAEARRICNVLEVPPDSRSYGYRLGNKAGLPAWRLVQRAAAEEGDGND